MNSPQFMIRPVRTGLSFMCNMFVRPRSIGRGLFILFCLFVFTTKSSAQSEFIIDDSTTSVNEAIDLRPYLYYLEDDEHLPVLFENISDQLPINKQHTFLLSIRNSTQDSVFYSLHFGDRYVNATRSTIQSLTNNTRVLNSSPLNEIPLRMAPHEVIKVFLDFKELDRLNPRKLSIKLEGEAALDEAGQRLAVTQSFFLGLFTFLSVFNLIIYFVTRWKVYIKYSLYITSALLYFLYYYGFLQEAFPGVRAISINLVSTWYYSVYILYFFFLNEFGQYKKYSPWAYRLLNIGIINKCIQLVYESILNPLGVEFIYAPWYKNFILGAEIILMIFIIYFILKNKDVRGRIVIVASLMLITGAILGQLDFDGNVRGSLVQLGITAELLTFSVGLGYLTKEFYRGQQKAQVELIDQLQKNQRMQESITEELEKTVLVRTRDIEKRNREYEMLLTEVHHRVKNNLQIISSLINLKLRQASPETTEALQQLNGRIYSMGLIHEKLYRKEDIQSIRLDEYLGEVSTYLLNSLGERERPIVLRQYCEPVEIDADRALACGLIANELITNAMKYAFTTDQTDCEIALNVEQKLQYIVVCISDNGRSNAGASQSFTKSFGLRFVDQLVSTKLGGSLQSTSENGLVIRITFPHHLNGKGEG